MAEEAAHGSSRRVDGCLAKAVRRKPGAVRAGDLAVEIGDGGDHRRPPLSRRTVVRATVAARVIPQSTAIVDGLDATIVQVGLDERPADRLRYGEEPLRRFRRSGGDGCANGLWGAARFSARQTQKASCLIGDIAKIDETAALADDVEEGAIFTRGRIRAMPGRARDRFPAL